ncbi:MAG: D-serine ammonia-lyase [Oscillospiraceae bacterium]|nr:D-serine ammonia-lyase [Oscillospiraceae bacterium]
MQNPAVEALRRGEETFWLNPKLTPFAEADFGYPLTAAQIADAEARLRRFAPFLAARFPETADGLIESALRETPAMQAALGCGIPGRMFLKMDCDLPIAGSVKARGGIYEVLKHTEDLARKAGLLTPDDDYRRLLEHRDFFSQYSVQVGSTGNLGMSIGIMSAAIGYRAVVHMSADAKQWKKDLLRQNGVTVREYGGDYSAAVQEGRRVSDADPKSYFVDDENSVDLFLGYAVAAGRTKAQLDALDIPVDAAHPLFVYLPCGVGGAPGGITFGMKQLFGDSVHCFFAEPTQAPCMLLGMATGLGHHISVQDIGLTGLTQADGLAVGRPSGFVGRVMENLLSGEATIRDARLFDYLRLLLRTENLFMEPSSCAAYAAPAALFSTEAGARYLETHCGTLAHATHIVWSTGGRLVPAEIREAYRNTYL